MRRPASVMLTSVALTLTPVASGSGATSGEPDPDPADTQPPAASGPSTNLERQLAEFAFVDYLLLDLEIDPSSHACSEPDSLDAGTPITCFAVVGDDRDDDGGLVVAETVVSDGTGIFEFELVEAASPPTRPADPTGTSEPAEPPEPTTDPRVTAEADAAVLSHGDLINDNAEWFIAAYLEVEQIAAIDQYQFDPVLMMLTLDLTLAAGVSFSIEDLAWGNTRELAGQHWAQGLPFRNDQAELRPGFTIIVDGMRYVSDHELMAQVADGEITRNAWVTIAERLDE